MTDEQLAIWRRLTPEQRQRVIDTRWVPSAGPYGDDVWVAYSEPQREDCCPLGVALPELGLHHPDSDEVQEYFSEGLDLDALDRAAGGASVAFVRLYEAELARIELEAVAFMVPWDRGQIPIADLVAALRQMQAV